jgi:catechol 2,3-dioxygenase-like lactoylglutathione lyase family enzyme
MKNFNCHIKMYNETVGLVNIAVMRIKESTQFTVFDMRNDDKRPPIWVGHIELETNNIEQSEEFMRLIGMRPVAKGDDFAVLELRGGTHLILIAKDMLSPGIAPFDLMVDDLEATRKKFSDLGLAPSPIEEGKIHSYFEIEEPAGNKIKFNSSHVSKLPV